MLHRIETAADLRLLERERSLHRITLQVSIDRSPARVKAGELRLRGARERAAARLRELAQLTPSIDALDHASCSLVMLAGESACAWAPLREALAERVVVAPHFALRPLLRALAREQRFRVLAVSTNRVATFEGDAHELHPTAVEGLPLSMEDALGSELHGDALTFRSEHAAPGQSRAIFHGHGSGDEEREIDRERFHRVLGTALDAVWGTSELPIVLASEQRMASELRAHVELPGLLAGEVTGSPDDRSAAELHALAWPRVLEAVERKERDVASGFERARNRGKAIDGDLQAAARLAIGGRIRRLWVEEEARVSARIDEGTALVVATSDPDEDALDALVWLVLQRAGEVRAVATGATPTGSAFCAELR